MVKHLFSFFISVLDSITLAVSASAAPSLLQPLPKSFNPGNAKVVFIKDRLSVLPKGFAHTKDGMPHRRCQLTLKINHSLTSWSQIENLNTNSSGCRRLISLHSMSVSSM